MKEISQFLGFVKDRDNTRPLRPTTDEKPARDRILMCISQDEQARMFPALLGINHSASFISTLPDVSADELMNIIHHEEVSHLLISHAQWTTVFSLLNRRSALLKRVKITVLASHQGIDTSFALIPKEEYIKQHASFSWGDQAFRKVAQQVYENHSHERLTPWGVNKDKIHNLYYSHVRLSLKDPDALHHRPETIMDDC